MNENLKELLHRSEEYAENTLSLQAAASVLPKELANLGGQISEVTAEGYPSNRFHSGTKFVDKIEIACIQAAQTAFNAKYANVQPLSCSMANIAVISALIKPGEKILSLGLKEGGHLTHGSKASLTGRMFDVSHYHLVEDRIDMNLVDEIAKKVRPRLIIAGASSYTRKIDFSTFREVADRNGALLMADVSHTSGLVVAGLIPSPIDHAHITTTSTYKQLYGPKGGLVLSGRDSDKHLAETRNPLSEVLDRSVFPSFQGTPDFAQIAMKAAALEAANTPVFFDRMKKVLDLAKVFEKEFYRLGLNLVSGGTDTHMLVIDLSEHVHSGKEIEKALEDVGIIANRNLIPGDKKSAKETSGLRIGTNVVAYRGLTRQVVTDVARIIGDVIKNPYANSSTKKERLEAIKSICKEFPLRAKADSSSTS